MMRDRNRNRQTDRRRMWRRIKDWTTTAEEATLKNLITFTCANCLSASQPATVPDGTGRPKAFNVNVMKLQTDWRLELFVPRTLDAFRCHFHSVLFSDPLAELLALLLGPLCDALCGKFSRLASSAVHRPFIATSPLLLLLRGRANVNGIKCQLGTCFAWVTLAGPGFSFNFDASPRFHLAPTELTARAGHSKSIIRHVGRALCLKFNSILKFKFHVQHAQGSSAYARIFLIHNTAGQAHVLAARRSQIFRLRM